MNKALVCAGLILLMTGCAQNPRIDSLSSSERAKVGEVKIFSGKPDRYFTILGEVSGLSCNRNLHQEQNVSDTEAMEGLKIKTVMLGGDAIVNTLCQKNSDTDWLNNCWASVKCIGDAAKLQ
ncbi:hypothetical protein [Aeromonas tecta]